LLPKAMTTVRLLLNPPLCEHAAAGAGAIGAAAEQVLPTGNRLLEEPLVFEGFAEDHAEHAQMPRIREPLEARAPLLDERPRGVTVRLEHALLRLPLTLGQLSRHAGHAGIVALGRRLDLAAHGGDRVAQPVQLNVLARDHVLVGVVVLVVSDALRRAEMPLAHG
jgi:hypothetical protein